MSSCSPVEKVNHNPRRRKSVVSPVTYQAKPFFAVLIQNNGYAL